MSLIISVIFSSSVTHLPLLYPPYSFPLSTYPNLLYDYMFLSGYGLYSSVISSLRHLARLDFFDWFSFWLVLIAGFFCSLLRPLLPVLHFSYPRGWPVDQSSIISFSINFLGFVDVHFVCASSYPTTPQHLYLSHKLSLWSATVTTLLSDSSSLLALYDVAIINVHAHNTLFHTHTHAAIVVSTGHTIVFVFFFWFLFLYYISFYYNFFFFIHSIPQFTLSTYMHMYICMYVPCALPPYPYSLSSIPFFSFFFLFSSFLYKKMLSIF